MESTKENSSKDLKKLSLKYQFNNKKSRVRFIVRVAIFSALSFIFYVFLKFPLPIFPKFLEINFSNLFIVMGSFLTGPIGGVLISIIRFLIKLPMSETACVGEATDLILSILVMLPASLTYYFKHDKLGGFLGILFSFISWILSSLLINYFISLPFYIEFVFKGDKSLLINFLSLTIKNINETNYMKYYLLYGVLPFNLINASINSIICALVYKKTSIILNRMGI